VRQNVLYPYINFSLYSQPLNSFQKSFVLAFHFCYNHLYNNKFYATDISQILKKINYDTSLYILILLQNGQIEVGFIRGLL
jgi:hypothetical protein